MESFKLLIELGGNDAGMVLDDAVPATVAKGIFNGAFQNSGQVCLAIKRLYVQESIYDEVCNELAQLADAAIVDDGSKQGTQLGPLPGRTATSLPAATCSTGRGFLSARPLCAILPRAAAWWMKNSLDRSCRC
jgi:delta 1-pyrroline-5-carboxylate dehydrogenase